MGEKNATLDFRLRQIDETRNYHLEETKHKELISKKHKKTCETLDFVERLLF